jgi:FkbM family methyltransferase
LSLPINRRTVKKALANLVPRSVYLAVNARIAARDIASRRRWAPEIDCLARFVHAGETVIDVGGNHGLYTYHLSRLVGPSGRVHTFEPMPPNLSILRHTIRAHHLTNVTLHSQACGDKDETVSFCIPLDHGVPQLGGAHQGKQGLTFDCEVVKLDEAISESVSFLKVDVEGAELLVFCGAQRILRECRPVILFEAGGHTTEYGYQQQEVFDFLSGFRYRFFSGGFSSPALEPRQGFTAAEDYFALPEEQSL